MLNALLIDHYDSFTYNIKSWLTPQFDVVILPYSHLKEKNLKYEFFNNFNIIIFSPGPKSPQDYPHSLELLKKLKSHIPILGICLGMQMITENYGGKVIPYSPPLHGKISALRFLKNSLNLMPTTEIHIARYHSLQCIQLPDSIELIAETVETHPVNMIIADFKNSVLGFQFHPESFLTEQSDFFLQMLQKFLTYK